MKKQPKDCFVSCIVAAGGSSRRMGENKLFMEIDGVPVIARTLIALNKCDAIDEIIVSAREEDMLAIGDLAKAYCINKLKAVVKGGKERAASVKAAISEISEDCDFVAVHDGARPLIDDAVIKSVVAGAMEFGAAACGVRPKATLKQEDENGFISQTLDRNMTYEIQTPQVFEKSLFLRAYDAETDALMGATDDCMLVERLGARVKITPGAYSNIKITTIEDIAIAACLLEDR